jgi:DNA-binding winged helix-turn-helix (wHTH) protein/Tol biopolymer transport system component
MSPNAGLEPSRDEYRFGDFVLDVEDGFLRLAGEEIPLQPKAFELLRYLVERPGRVVSKTELTDAVWRGTAVTDNSLSQCMAQVRRALGDESQTIIRTVARRGYVFAAPLTSPVREFPKIAEPRSDDSPLGVNAWHNRWLSAGVAIIAAVAGVSATVGRGVLARVFSRTQSAATVYEQLTNFPDSAAGPVLSPDGRMVAFFRGEGARAFASTSPIYAKILPSGEAVRITNDPRNKYGLAFSPDGSQITYTAWEGSAKFQWQTFTVPALGGEPRLMFANAAGLSWLDPSHLLYSEIRTGLHMGVVTSNLDRSGRREIYFPEHERRMAHYSYPSPDHKWILTVEMEPTWLACRIVPFDGSSSGREVGPRGACTSAAWSRDGKWMYFGAEVNGAHHLWRQRFSDGQAEQITFGAAEEEGLAVAPDGSLVTSVGVNQSAVWIHDAQGEHPISPEGFAPANYLVLTAPLFSLDGRDLYYLLRRESASSARELWRTNLESNVSESVIQGFAIEEFDISGDKRTGGQVIFSSRQEGKPSELWLAPLDRSAAPRRIAASGEGSPHFGPNGTVWFRYSDGKANYVGLMNRDGSARRQALARPISTVANSSPDGRWLAVMAPAPDRPAVQTIAISATGDEPRKICPGRCGVVWGRDGRYVYIGDGDAATKEETLAIPVSSDGLPALPAGSIRVHEQANLVRGARLIQGVEISPGPDPSTFAYVKWTTHRNLFRISFR